MDFIFIGLIVFGLFGMFYNGCILYFHFREWIKDTFNF